MPGRLATGSAVVTTPRDQPWPVLVLAREYVDRIARRFALAVVRRLLRDELEALRRRVADLGLGRERHASPRLGSGLNLRCPMFDRSASEVQDDRQRAFAPGRARTSAFGKDRKNAETAGMGAIWPVAACPL
jgi:hypothetical protein